MVRALTYCAEDHVSGSTSSQWLDARSLSNQQRMGTRWKHWGDKGGKERSWTPYLTKLMAQDKCPLKQALPQRIWDLLLLLLLLLSLVSLFLYCCGRIARKLAHWQYFQMIRPQILLKETSHNTYFVLTPSESTRS